MDSLRFTLSRPARVPSGVNVSALDRLISGALACLFARAFWRARGFTKMVALATAGEFARRAFSGHSYLYSTLGLATNGPSAVRTSRDLELLSPAAFPRMDFDIKRTVTIARPVHEVYARILDRESWLKKLPGLGLTHLPQRVWVHAQEGDRTRDLSFEVFALSPDREISWRACDRDNRVHAVGALVFAVAPQSRGTELTLAFRTPGHRHGHLAGLLTGLIDRDDQIAKRFLKQIKQLIECGEIAVARRL